ncbi:MAG TPA: sigma-54 dependent transcriptional regulator [Verrucomicrobiae bacterium]|jgi:DNA-binding NtrC family response regulator|nr:sigma-54 dependent transcriptional regulator [Verrucomicrobiae bacterium]
MSASILVAEDQEMSRRGLAQLLREQGFQVAEAEDGLRAVASMDDNDFDLVLTDLMMPGADGITVLRHAREHAPQTLVMLMTGHASIETAIEALQLGAQDYILKPLILEDVVRKVRHLIEHKKLAWENQMLRREISEHFATGDPVGKSAAMHKLVTLIDKVAPTPTTVLITGESGVGKEVVARSIHARSDRRDTVFLPVNCSAIPETLLESQLFGHVKGSFTGAVASQEGLFQRARGGTIFLDEIGEIPLSLQVKLLRVIEEKQLLSVGSTHPTNVDVRIITATNRDLKTETDAGRFRADLFYRLNVFEIHIPPLRERREDIPSLIEYLICRHNREMKRNYKGVDNAAMRLIMALPWKGNIRELDNVLERAMILGSGEWITPHDLTGQEPSQYATDDDWRLEKVLSDYERFHIKRSLEKTAGDKKLASEMLGLSLSTLYRKLEKWNVA